MVSHLSAVPEPMPQWPKQIDLKFKLSKALEQLANIRVQGISVSTGRTEAAGQEHACVERVVGILCHG